MTHECLSIIDYYIHSPSLTPLDLLFIEEATCLDDHVPFFQPPGFQHRFLTNCCKDSWKKWCRFVHQTFVRLEEECWDNAFSMGKWIMLKRQRLYVSPRILSTTFVLVISPIMLFYCPFRIAHSVLVQKNPHQIPFQARIFLYHWIILPETNILRNWNQTLGRRSSWDLTYVFPEKKIAVSFKEAISSSGFFLGYPTLGNKTTWRIGYRI